MCPSHCPSVLTARRPSMAAWQTSPIRRAGARSLSAEILFDAVNASHPWRASDKRIRKSFAATRRLRLQMNQPQSFSYEHFGVKTFKLERKQGSALISAHQCSTKIPAANETERSPHRC